MNILNTNVPVIQAVLPENSLLVNSDFELDDALVGNVWSSFGFVQSSERTAFSRDEFGSYSRHIVSSGTGGIEQWWEPDTIGNNGSEAKNNPLMVLGAIWVQIGRVRFEILDKSDQVIWYSGWAGASQGWTILRTEVPIRFVPDWYSGKLRIRAISGGKSDWFLDELIVAPIGDTLRTLSRKVNMLGENSTRTNWLQAVCATPANLQIFVREGMWWYNQNAPTWWNGGWFDLSNIRVPANNFTKILIGFGWSSPVPEQIQPSGDLAPIYDDPKPVVVLGPNTSRDPASLLDPVVPAGMLGVAFVLLQSNGRGNLYPIGQQNIQDIRPFLFMLTPELDGGDAWGDMERPLPTLVGWSFAGAEGGPLGTSIWRTIAVERDVFGWADAFDEVDTFVFDRYKMGDMFEPPNMFSGDMFRLMPDYDHPDYTE